MFDGIVVDLGRCKFVGRAIGMRAGWSCRAVLSVIFRGRGGGRGEQQASTIIEAPSHFGARLTRLARPEATTRRLLGPAEQLAASQGFAVNLNLARTLQKP